LALITLPWWNPRRKRDSTKGPLNERGGITECASANLFSTKDGITRKPPLSGSASPKVTRAAMLKELDLTAPPLIASVLWLEDLHEADEVFITSTSRELTTVQRLHDREVAGGENVRQFGCR